MSHFGTTLRAAGAACGIAAALASCGARTGLLAPEPDASVIDAGDDAEAVKCHPGSFTLAKARPTVMFVVDRSGSMNTRFSSAGSRWAVLGKALASALPPVDPTMQIGLLVFPLAGSSRSDTSCGLPGAVNLLPALHNVQPLLGVLGSTGAGGATPTADAISLAGKALLGVRTAKSARAMVLATDGGPNCNSALDPATCVCADLGQNCRRDGALCLDDKRTVSRIAGFADHRMQIPLWVGTGAYLLLAVVSAALGLVHVVTGVRVRSGKGLILLMVSIGACLISMVFALYCFPFSVGALIYSGVVLADPSCRRILDGVEPG